MTYHYPWFIRNNGGGREISFPRFIMHRQIACSCAIVMVEEAKSYFEGGQHEAAERADEEQGSTRYFTY